MTHIKDDNDRLRAGALPTDHRAGTRPAGQSRRQSHRTSADEATPGPWPELVPIGAPENLPAFPLELLDDWLARFVEAVSEQIQVPPDLVAMCGLSALSAVCQRRFWIEASPGWRQPALLWTLVMLASGNRKTAAFEFATRPLRAFTKRKGLELAERIAAEHGELRMLKGSLVHAERTASTSKKQQEREDAKREAQELARQVEKFRLTPDPLLFLSEATPERLEEMLVERGRAALLADEAGLLGLLAGRYRAGKSAPNLDPFLKGYEGCTVHVGRMKRPDGSGGDRHAEAAHVTIGLAPQPDVALPLLRSSEAFADTGFLWRFLFALPRSMVGDRKIKPPAAPARVLDEYEKKMGELLEMPEPFPDCSENEIPVLRVSEEAAAALGAFQAEIEPRLKEHVGDLAGLGSWGAKLVAQIVRLAGLLHASKVRAEPWGTPIEVDTMQRAINFAPYFIAHAKAARFEMQADPETKRAQRAIRWIRERCKAGGPRVFTRSELHKAIAKNKPVDEINPLLILLKRHAAIREVAAAKDTGGAPCKTAFEIHPDLAEVAND